MAKVVTLRSGGSSDEGTFGVLSFGDSVIRSLELPWRDNKPRVSCIPAGTYECRLVTSPRFGRVYGVIGVPGRSNILIHPANLAGDASLGWTTELQGCIAPCLKRGMMRNKAGVMQAAGLLSRPAVELLRKWSNGSPFQLEIIR